jgi:hypothetical protein
LGRSAEVGQDISVRSRRRRRAAAMLPELA